MLSETQYSGRKEMRVACCVAPLDRGMAIAGEARLAVNIDKLTELAIITLIAYWPGVIKIFECRQEGDLSD